MDMSAVVEKGGLASEPVGGRSRATLLPCMCEGSYGLREHPTCLWMSHVAYPSYHG